MIDIFGLNGYMRYFCTRFPRDGEPIEIDMLQVRIDCLNEQQK